jgi:hypothetical protein
LEKSIFIGPLLIIKDPADFPAEITAFALSAIKLPTYLTPETTLEVIFFTPFQIESKKPIFSIFLITLIKNV